MKKLILFQNADQMSKLLESHIKQLSNGAPLQILEAGCGQSWPIGTKETNYHITGVDIDKNALEIRKTQKKDLDKIIIGDLRFIDLQPNKYDVIFNSFVLEHIENAKKVLDNFSKWLKPGGLLILRIPERNSAYGFFTRIIPFKFRVAFKKYIMGQRNAGKPGFAPYPVVYEKIISRQEIHKYCEKNNLIIKDEYGDNFLFRNMPTVIVHFCKFLFKIFSIFSFGKLTSHYLNLTFILEKI